MTPSHQFAYKCTHLADATGVELSVRATAGSRMESRRMVRLLMILIAFYTFSAIAHAQTPSPYELTLGMHKNEVNNIFPYILAKSEKTKSCCSDEVWEFDNFGLYFCKSFVTAIRIDLQPNLAAFNRAVSSEQKGRGSPTMSFEPRLGGSTKAEWRMEPYRFLSISIDQYSDGSMKVYRWQQDIRQCEN